MPLQALPKMKINDGVVDLCKLLDEAQVPRYLRTQICCCIPAPYHDCCTCPQPRLTLQGTPDKKHIKGSGTLP